MLHVGPEVGVGDGRTGGIVDLNGTRYAGQGGDGKGHRDAVVAVGSDGRIARAAARDDPAVVTLLGVCADGLQALDVYRERREDIDVVLLDMTMPHLSGVETFSEIKRLREDARVIIMSGYTESAATEGIDTGWSSFVQKPFHFRDLRSALRKALDG